MKLSLVMFIVLCGAGCITTNFGAPFDANVHGTVEPGMSKVIVYRWDDGLSGRYHAVNIASVRTALIVRGGFIEQSLPAGQVTVSAGSATADVALQQGEVTFLQIGEKTTRTYIECDIQKDTARLCARIQLKPTLAIVDAATALPQLAHFKEICNDC